MLPFHITCKLPAPRLYELADSRFQIVEQGPLAPFMAGYQYLLVEQALAHFLGELKIERVRHEAAVLFRRSSGEEHRTHVCLRVGQFFRHDQLHDLSLDGLRLLTMNDQYYFASPELKVRLETSPFKYLCFTEGLTDFAANNP